MKIIEDETGAGGWIFPSAIGIPVPILLVPFWCAVSPKKKVRSTA